jgi:transcriptional regulator with XRE-family HTH domain
MDNTGTRIALRVRLERDARGWSQAERSGVSKATVSKIERGEMSPTAVTLVRLAGAFDLTLAGLLVRAESGAGPVLRAADQPVWCDPAIGYRRKQVFSRPDHPVEIIHVELPAGQSVAFPASSYGRIRQVVWVQSGALVIQEGGARHVLNAGDCLGFGPPSAVTLANETTSPGVYVVTLARS